jgi:hypothetical protein
MFSSLLFMLKSSDDGGRSGASARMMALFEWLSPRWTVHPRGLVKVMEVGTSPDNSGANDVNEGVLMSENASEDESLEAVLAAVPTEC